MDLVDEQERALPLRTARARGVEDLFQFRHAGMDRRELHECVVAGSADEARDRRLALPGGPQKIIEPSEDDASRRVSAPSGPVRCSWPETSASVIGRSRSASGAGGG